jgi:hypothetical protein
VRARIIARLGAVLIIMWGVVLWATVVVAGARAAATDRNQQRWVSYWLSLSHVNATVAMDTLRAAGGSNVATSLPVSSPTAATRSSQTEPFRLAGARSTHGPPHVTRCCQPSWMRWVSASNG